MADHPVFRPHTLGRHFGKETSAETLRQIEAEGLLANVSLAVYVGLNKYGPCTGGELARTMREERMRSGQDVPDWLTSRAIRARLSDLRDRDAVRETEPRKCRVTGRRVIVWEISGRLPGPKPKKRLTAKDKRIIELEARVGELEAKLAVYEREKTQVGLFDTLRVADD